MRWLQGRDANRRLTRAIKAGKARERLPALVQHIGGQMQAWVEEQGGPFLLDGRDCQACAACSCASVLGSAVQ